MRKRFRWIGGLLVVGFLVSFGSSLSAADYDNIKIGPVGVGLNAGLSLRWTDNVGLTKSNTDSDWSATANLGLTLRYPMTEYLEMNLQANLGYTQWSDHDEATGGLAGTSALSFDLPVAGWKLNLHDSYTRATDPVGPGDPFVANVAKFDRSTNAVGLTALKECNKVKFTVGYDFLTYRTETDAYRDLERDTHKIFADLAAAVNPKVDLFTRYSHDTNDTLNNVFNDSTADSLEVGLRGRITPRLTGDVAVGYEIFDFSKKGGVADASDFNGLTVRSRLSHKISNLTTQSLDLSYKPWYGYSVEANYFKWWNATYTLNHRFTKRTSGHFSYAYDSTDESGSDPSREKTTRNIFGLGASTQMNPKTTFSLDYSLVVKDTNRTTFGHDYQQNNLIASLNYTF